MIQPIGGLDMEDKICNMCGRVLEKTDCVIKEDYLESNKECGYFSKKDGKKYSWCLCEECSDKLMDSFKIPPKVNDIEEFL